jgi:hypothetical protein
LRIQRRDRLDPEHHTKRPVVRPAVAHGIEMAADHQRRGTRNRAFVAADEIGGGVGAHRHAGGLHPPAKRALRGGVSRRQVSAK